MQQLLGPREEGPGSLRTKGHSQRIIRENNFELALAASNAAGNIVAELCYTLKLTADALLCSARYKG